MANIKISRITVKKTGYFLRNPGDHNTEISIYKSIGLDDKIIYRDNDTYSFTYGEFFDGNPINKKSIPLNEECVKVIR